MKLGFQLVTLYPLSLRKGDYFAIDILANNSLINEGSGRDTYQVHTILHPNKNLAGTGRCCIYTPLDLQPGAELFEAKNCQCVELPPDIETLMLHLNTNRLLDVRKLLQELSLKIFWQVNNHESLMELNLQEPNLRIEWVGRGTFLLDLTQIYHSLTDN